MATLEEKMAQLPTTGHFISVLWPVDSTWRVARITAVDALQGVHTVRYANDLVEKLDLTKEAWRMEQGWPAQPPPVPATVEVAHVHMGPDEAEANGGDKSGVTVVRELEAGSVSEDQKQVAADDDAAAHLLLDALAQASVATSAAAEKPKRPRKRKVQNGEAGGAGRGGGAGERKAGGRGGGGVGRWGKKAKEANEGNAVRRKPPKDDNNPAGKKRRTKKEKEGGEGEAGEATPDPAAEGCDASVLRWLQQLKLEHYAGLFALHQVSAASLPALTLQQLKQLPVSAVGARRRMLVSIEHMRLTGTDPSSAASDAPPASPHISAPPAEAETNTAVPS